MGTSRPIALIANFTGLEGHVGMEATSRALLTQLVKRGFDIDIISEILGMTQNIYQTFIKANFKAKRHYLSIFFEKFEIKDREIAKITYAPLFKHLLKTDAYRLRSNWLRERDSNSQPWS